MNLAIVGKTAFLLVCSNLFMTFAWYGHLRYRDRSLGLVILVSWGIAFFEYCLQVPANRLGAEVMHASQLKVMQEVITFCVFGVFSLLYLGQRLTWYDGVAFALVVAAAAVSLFQPA